MKRFIALFLALVFTGCAAQDEAADRFLTLRQTMQSANQCTFRTAVTSDYGDYLHSFVLDCAYDGELLTFTVVAPDSIAGITGQFRGEKGALTFDGKILALESLADGQIPPVSAPWILLRSLIGGYLEATSEISEGIILHLRETYADDSVKVQVQLNDNGHPWKAEIIWQGRRILTMDVENFQVR